MIDENLFETNPNNYIPVTDVEMEEYILARETVKKNYLKKQHEEGSNYEYE